MPPLIVKLMFLLKAHALSLGHSGVQLITVQRIIDFFNNDVLPIVYDRGSLGASGDFTPQILLPEVWPLPRSLATTGGISFDFFSSPYLDVSVQAVPHVHLWIQCTLTEVCSAGFPHSEIPGSMDICSSPRLIAACHVLLRLLMPRHSSYALYSLNMSFVLLFSLA